MNDALIEAAKHPINQRLKAAAILLAACILANAPQASAQQLLEGELPVRSCLPMVGRETLPGLAELESAARSAQDEVLFVCRLAVTDSHIYGPRWAPLDSGPESNLVLAWQSAELKKEQGKVSLLSALREAASSAVKDDYSYENSLIWALGAPQPRPAYGLISNVTGSPQVHLGLLGLDEPARLTEDEPTKRHASASIDNEGRVAVVYDSGRELKVTRIRRLTEVDIANAETQSLGLGTQGSWDSEGKRVVYIREIYGEKEAKDRVQNQEITVLSYQLAAPVMIARSEAGEILRSPSWSPDGRQVAYYKRRAGVDPIWDLYICDVSSQLNKPQRLAEEVVIESVFEHVGPAFSSDSSALLYFSQRRREEEYYPIQRISVRGEALPEIPYPKSINVANDLHLRPWSNGELLLFTGLDRGPRQLFVALLLKARSLAPMDEK